MAQPLYSGWADPFGSMSISLVGKNEWERDTIHAGDFVSVRYGQRGFASPTNPTGFSTTTISGILVPVIKNNGRDTFDWNSSDPIYVGSKFVVLPKFSTA